MRPHRQQPTRLRHPWDSPDKNTGVGFHFLLQCMKVKSESEVTQSCPTLSDPMDCSLPCSSVHGIKLSLNKVNYFSPLWQYFSYVNIATFLMLEYPFPLPPFYGVYSSLTLNILNSLENTGTSRRYCRSGSRYHNRVNNATNQVMKFSVSQCI